LSGGFFSFRAYHPSHQDHKALGCTGHRQLRGQLCGPPRERILYWDDVPSRQIRPEMLTREQAMEQAKALARAEREKEGDQDPMEGAGGHFT
jgi:hypothetical protein